jgi:hypothetical protein
MRKIKNLKSVEDKLNTIQKAVQNKQDEYELMLMDIEEMLGCDNTTLTALGRIVTKYFGLTVTPEIFESELEHIMSIKDVSEYIEGMKSQLPSAEELAALAEIVKRKNW